MVFYEDDQSGKVGGTLAVETECNHQVGRKKDWIPIPLNPSANYMEDKNQFALMNLSNDFLLQG